MALCECGCGAETNINKNTKMPRRFVAGHGSRKHDPMQDNFVIVPSGCWEWVGPKNAKGYGQFKRYGNVYLAHRYSYRLFKGVIANGLFICHRCNNKACINPEHLYAGTAQDNMNDRMIDGKYHTGKKGSEHSNSKLTEDDIVRIAERYSQGISALQLAEEYAVTKNLIYGILHKDTWKHVRRLDVNAKRLPPRGKEFYMLKSKGFTSTQVAESFGISKTAVNLGIRKYLKMMPMEEL